MTLYLSKKQLTFVFYDVDIKEILLSIIGKQNQHRTNSCVNEVKKDSMGHSF